MVKGRRQVLNPRPIVPDTGWRRPTSFPDLSAASALCVDLETWDPDLKEHGPGYGRGKGHIIGVAIATDDGLFKEYYPIRHREEEHDNFDPGTVLAWAKEQLERKDIWVIGHNLLYDLGFLSSEGINVTGKLYDTWIGEKLLRHRNDCSLEATGQRHVGKGKKSTLLLRWLHQFYGRGRTPEDDDLDDSQKGNLFRAPPRLVGPYAISDVELPFEIAEVQRKLLTAAGLDDVFELECGLLPLLVKMRMEGVTVDVAKAEEADVKVSQEIQDLQTEIDALAGRHVEVGSGEDVGKLLVGRGFKVPQTAKTKKYSITEEILKKVDDPVAEKISDIKELLKFQSTFIRSYVINSHVKGRIHAEFNQMQAITGRFSSSRPNLTNIPSRNAELMKVIRGIFIPDAGHYKIRKYDYSQVECRILAHFATGRGADALRAEYNAKPETNYHKLAHRMILDTAGVDLPHKSVKAVNFAIIYSAGQAKLAKMIGLAKQEVEPFFEAYHRGMSFVRDTMDSISQETAKRGYTLTVMGRRVLFDTWEPKHRDFDSERVAYSYDEAVKKFGSQIKRAGLHRSINYVIQGSAADLLKSAMLKSYQDGVYDVTGIPKGVIHDEQLMSVPDASPATMDAYRELKRIMETAIPFRVPILVSGEEGDNWGHTEEFDNAA